MVSWIYLIFAAVSECFWATTMKLSNGFTNLGYSIATVIGCVVSFGALVLATKTLPISIAYPIWTGIGAVGTVIVGVCLFKDNISLKTWVFVILLIISVIGIKATYTE